MRSASRSKRSVLLSLLGGEPLLWAPLASLEGQLLELGLALGVTTNGTTLGSPNVRRRLLERYAELTVSIDGLAATHDRLRALDGAYQAALARRAIAPSMSRVGNCWDNAIVESFFSSLKVELLSAVDWRTHHEAEAAVASYLRFYNQQRLHSALGYRSPANYETGFATAV